MQCRGAIVLDPVGESGKEVREEEVTTSRRVRLCWWENADSSSQYKVTARWAVGASTGTRLSPVTECVPSGSMSFRSKRLAAANTRNVPQLISGRFFVVLFQRRGRCLEGWRLNAEAPVNDVRNTVLPACLVLMRCCCRRDQVRKAVLRQCNDVGLLAASKSEYHRKQTVKCMWLILAFQ